MPIQPETAVEVVDLVCSSEKLVAVGNGTKAPLVHHEAATHLSTKQLDGILHYEPREYTFTARAGTSVDEVVEMLAKKNQYLPFDPIEFGPSGSTLGGLVATGIAGSGRYRYGGVRDFIVGVEMVTGYGKVVRGGGKVVKNAAGFDLPKLVTSSLGRLGVLTELSFKVFPVSLASRTVSVACQSHAEALTLLRDAGRRRWELDAIDYFQNGRVEIRIAGPPKAIDTLADEIAREYQGELRDPVEADLIWQDVRRLSMFKESKCLFRVPCTPKTFEQWATLNSPVAFHLAGGGNAMWIGCRDDQVDEVSRSLDSLWLTGLAVRGENASALIGYSLETEMRRRIHQVFDPDGKFDTRTPSTNSKRIEENQSVV